MKSTYLVALASFVSLASCAGLSKTAPTPSTSTISSTTISKHVETVAPFCLALRDFDAITSAAYGKPTVGSQPTEVLQTLGTRAIDSTFVDTNYRDGFERAKRGADEFAMSGPTEVRSSFRTLSHYLAQILDVLEKYDYDARTIAAKATAADFELLSNFDSPRNNFFDNSADNPFPFDAALYSNLQIHVTKECSLLPYDWWDK